MKIKERARQMPKFKRKNQKGMTLPAPPRKWLESALGQPHGVCGRDMTMPFYKNFRNGGK